MELLPSERIELLRSKMNMNQRDFAELIGTSQATLSKIIRSKTDPGFKTLKGICENVGNVNMEWLLCGRGEMFKSDNEKPSPEAPDLNLILKRIETLERLINEK